MKQLIMSFIRQHGERLFFILFATVFATVMYAYIPSTRDQVVAVYFLLLGLIINKARSPKEDAAAEPVEPKEPPTILGNSGRVSMAFLLYLALAVAGLCAILLGTYACVKPVIKQDVVEKIAISISAKALGQHMQGRMEWGEEEDAFVKMITKDGLTLSSGQIATDYLMPKVPALYQRDARILMESVGFEFSGDELTSVAKVDKALLLEAVGAFKEGLTYKKQAKGNTMFTLLPAYDPSPGYVLQGLTEKEIDEIMLESARAADIKLGL